MIIELRKNGEYTEAVVTNKVGDGIYEVLYPRQKEARKAIKRVMPDIVRKVTDALLAGEHVSIRFHKLADQSPAGPQPAEVSEHA